MVYGDIDTGVVCQYSTDSPAALECIVNELKAKMHEWWCHQWSKW